MSGDEGESAPLIQGNLAGDLSKLVDRIQRFKTGADPEGGGGSGGGVGSGDDDGAGDGREDEAKLIQDVRTLVSRFPREMDALARENNLDMKALKAGSVGTYNRQTIEKYAGLAALFAAWCVLAGWIQEPLPAGLAWSSLSFVEGGSALDDAIQGKPAGQKTAIFLVTLALALNTFLGDAAPDWLKPLSGIAGGAFITGFIGGADQARRDFSQAGLLSKLGAFGRIVGHLSQAVGVAGSVFLEEPWFAQTFGVGGEGLVLLMEAMKTFTEERDYRSGAAPKASGAAGSAF